MNEALVICKLQSNLLITPGKDRKQMGSRTLLMCRNCKQMQKGTGNKYALLFNCVNGEILSILGSLNQYQHEGSSWSYIPSIALCNLQDRNWCDCQISCPLTNLYHHTWREKLDKTNPILLMPPVGFKPTISTPRLIDCLNHSATEDFILLENDSDKHYCFPH